MKSASLCITLILLMFSQCLNAQQIPQVKPDPASSFRQFFAVEVSGLKSGADLKKVEDQILKDKRFLLCKTDFKSSSIFIAAEKGVAIEDVKHYTSLFNLVIINYSEKLSEENPGDLINKMNLPGHHD